VLGICKKTELIITSPQVSGFDAITATFCKSYLECNSFIGLRCKE
jgi:hypothetical protein